MEQQEWPQEPWFVNPKMTFVLLANNRRTVAYTVAQSAMRFAAEQEATARRIAACVNACAGIPTEELDQGARPTPKPDMDWFGNRISEYLETLDDETDMDIADLAQYLKQALFQIEEGQKALAEGQKERDQ